MNSMKSSNYGMCWKMGTLKCSNYRYKSISLKHRNCCNLNNAFINNIWIPCKKINSSFIRFKTLLNLIILIQITLLLIITITITITIAVLKDSFWASNRVMMDTINFYCNHPQLLIKNKMNKSKSYTCNNYKHSKICKCNNYQLKCISSNLLPNIQNNRHCNNNSNSSHSNNSSSSSNHHNTKRCNKINNIITILSMKFKKKSGQLRLKYCN